MQRVSAPALFTFDIFGTVVDWRRGLALDVAAAGCVQRSHCRPGPADFSVQDLLELAGQAASAGRG